MNDLKLDSKDGEAQNLYNGNNDLAALLTNYIKCNAINNGCGNGTDFYKNDETIKKLFGYLLKVNKDLHNEFFEDRKKAEASFDEAVRQLS